MSVSSSPSSASAAKLANGPVTVNCAVVVCDGGGLALGHPRVSLNIAASGEIACPYCGRRYIQSSNHRAVPGH